ncbi:preprotein translocase subunit SecE [Candidatus Epulonipiscium fishelsonii]|uniref:Preprotein translocase subunit SecE n=1 Tax=Candidatus Epulonipiscium fishelsonii TaxID=77094 RepID=A0ACC8XGG2_9FIRM|nr:preprotein translocase subunit SecE [Epulopiscium sp. SCG-B05WGA-EpuloA1]ONI42566.1 preprotein translocase subunit SecE [Epulopiscium sp. SCG-B11WGA-EpuloA1]
MGEFFRDFVAESKRIIWPSKEELFSKTGAVVSMCVLVAIILVIMDLVFNQGISLIHQLI